MQDELNRLKEDIFYQARRYIADMGEFVPFGSFLENGKVRPVMCEHGEFDTIDGKVVVNDLKGFFTEKFKNGISNAGAIAYDVVISITNADGDTVRRDALCLITSVDGENWTEDYYPYMVIDGQCIWK